VAGEDESDKMGTVHMAKKAYRVQKKKKSVGGGEKGARVVNGSMRKGRKKGTSHGQGSSSNRRREVGRGLWGVQSPGLGQKVSQRFQMKGKEQRTAGSNEKIGKKTGGNYGPRLNTESAQRPPISRRRGSNSKSGS